MCGGITAVVLSRGKFFDLTLLRITLDWHGILAVVSALGSYHRLDFSVLCSLYMYMCVLATYAPYIKHPTISAARKSSDSLLLPARSVLPRLTSRNTATAHSVKGIKYPQ